MRKRAVTLVLLATIVFSGVMSTGCGGHGRGIRKFGVKMIKQRARLLTRVFR